MPGGKDGTEAIRYEVFGDGLAICGNCQLDNGDDGDKSRISQFHLPFTVTLSCAQDWLIALDNVSAESKLIHAVAIIIGCDRGTTVFVEGTLVPDFGADAQEIIEAVAPANCPV